MAFRGSIDPIGAHELLRRVAAHDDPGMLTVSDGHSTHMIWIGHGDIVCAAPDAPIDVVAHILDGDGGTFLFEADRAAPRPGVRAPFAETLDIARGLHDELGELIACVPSPAHEVRWSPRLRGPVEIDAGTWSLLVAITAMPTTDVLAAREGSDLLARRAVRHLVDAGLVEVFEADVPSPVIAPEKSARRRPADLDVDPDLEFAMLPPADLFFSELPSSTDEPIDDGAVSADAMVLLEVASIDGGEQLVHEIDAAAVIDPGDLSDWHISEDNLDIDESGWATSRALEPAIDDAVEPEVVGESDDAHADANVDAAAEIESGASDDAAWDSDDGWGDGAWGQAAVPADEPAGWGDIAPDDVDAVVDVGWGDAAIETAEANLDAPVGEPPMAALPSPATPSAATGPAAASPLVPPSPSPLVPNPPLLVPPPPAPVAPADKVGDDADATSPTDAELLSRAQIYRFLSSMRS